MGDPYAHGALGRMYFNGIGVPKDHLKAFHHLSKAESAKLQDKRPRLLLFDEATSALDQQTADRFAVTVNKLKGVATILFIAHQVPRGLAVDEVMAIGNDKATQVSVVEEGRAS
jgi:ABC-type nitrate/sulfonate/bicarbonate transport system ATPase subunit